MIIHLGKNPVSGGSPPKDSIVSKIKIVNTGDLFHIRDNDNVVVEDENMNNINVEIVIIM